MVRPGQPRRRIGKDLGAVLLQCHQVMQSIATSVEAGRHQTGEHTGDIGAVLSTIKERILALPDEQFQRSFHQIIIQGSARDGYKLRQITMPQ